MDLSLEKFIAALHTLELSSSDGQDESLKKFSSAIKNLMPDELRKGKYKSLGNLLETLNTEFMPLLSTSYYAKDTNRRRLVEGVKDILETVDYILKKLMEQEDGADEIVRDTLINLNSRLKKMTKLKDKFEFIAIRQRLRNIFVTVPKLVEKVDIYLGKGEHRSETKESFEDVIRGNIYSKDEALLSSIYQAYPNGAQNLNEHQDHYASQVFTKKYVKIVSKLIKNALRHGIHDFKGLNSDVKNLICYGMISKRYWEGFGEKLTSNYETERQLEQLQEGFNIKDFTDHLQTREEYSLFQVSDWMEWSASMYCSIPLLMTTRKNLTFYRNLSVEIFSKLNEYKENLNTIVEGLDKSKEVQDCFEKFEKTIIQESKSNARAILEKELSDLGIEKGHGVFDVIQNIQMVHQIIWIIEQEMTQIVLTMEQFFRIHSADDKYIEPSDSSLESPMMQFEGLVNQCALGVQSDQILPMKYTPLCHSSYKHLSVENICILVKRLEVMFPQMYFPLETFSFKRQISFKTKEIMDDFTAKNFAEKLRILRTEFKELSNPSVKLKVLLFPGMGNGSYDALSNTLMVPMFHLPQDLIPRNFFAALADYLLATRHAKLGGEVFEQLWSIMDDKKIVPPQLSISNHLALLTLALRELFLVDVQTNFYKVGTELLKPAFRLKPTTLTEDHLDEEILDLVNLYKKSV